MLEQALGPPGVEPFGRDSKTSRRPLFSFHCSAFKCLISPSCTQENNTTQIKRIESKPLFKDNLIILFWGSKSNGINIGLCCRFRLTISLCSLLISFGCTEIDSEMKNVWVWWRWRATYIGLSICNFNWICLWLVAPSFNTSEFDIDWVVVWRLNPVWNQSNRKIHANITGFLHWLGSVASGSKFE